MSQNHRLSIENIKSSVALIDSVFLNTPQYHCKSLSQLFDIDLTVKVETINPIRSFKGRGTEVLVSKSKEHNHLICSSAGNLGQAMAYSCSKRGMKVTVHTSKHVNPFKLQMMRLLGAKVELSGNDFDEAKATAKKQAKLLNVKFIEDTVDIETLEGAGTIGLELLKLPYELDALLIALGDGAMFTGISRIMKEYSPKTKLIAIQSKGAPALIESLRKNEYISYEKTNTIADGISVKTPIPQALKDISLLIDDSYLVDDASIKEGMQLLYQHLGVVTEPSAAVGLAAILENKNQFVGKKVGTIICGSNITHNEFMNCIK